MNALGHQLAEYTISFLKSFGFDQLIGFAENVRTQVDAIQLQEGLLQGMSISNRRLEYNNPADKYKPSPQVETGAAIITEGGFYANTPVPQAPVGLLAMGLVAGLILCLIWLFRCCMPVLNCGPKGVDSGVLTEEVANENKAKGKRIWIATIVFIIIVSTTDFIVFDGNSHFGDGVVTITDCIETLIKIFTGLFDACIYTRLGSNIMKQSMEESDCKYALDYAQATTSMGANIDELSNRMGTYSQYIVDSLSQLDRGKTAINLYDKEYREMAVMGIFAIVFSAIILLTLCHVFKWRLAMKFALAYTYIIYVLTVVFTFPFMVFVAILGVFCLGPIEFIWTFIKVDIIQFYTSCDAIQFVDILKFQIDKAKDAFGSIEILLANTVPEPSNSSQNVRIADLCGGIVDGKNMTFEGFDQINTQMNCEPIRDTMFKFFNKGLCVDVYNGMYSMWGSLLSTGFFLFFLMILASISYSYYDIG